MTNACLSLCATSSSADEAQPGQRAKDVYAYTLGVLSKENRALCPHFVRSLGHATGVFLRNKAVTINDTCT